MQSKAEEAYQIIKHKIIMLEMRPTSDVSEEELIQELGISRTPIREAIQRLAKDRFVIIYPRSNYRSRYLHGSHQLHFRSPPFERALYGA